MQTFEVNGKTYEIKFSVLRAKMYEDATGVPLMTSFYKNGGVFSITEITNLVAYGLRVEGGGWVSPKQGRDMAMRLLEENDYMALYEAVVDALQRDCGFFFGSQSGQDSSEG